VRYEMVDVRRCEQPVIAAEDHALPWASIKNPRNQIFTTVDGGIRFEERFL